MPAGVQRFVLAGLSRQPPPAKQRQQQKIWKNLIAHNLRIAMAVNSMVVAKVLLFSDICKFFALFWRIQGYFPFFDEVPVHLVLSVPLYRGMTYVLKNERGTCQPDGKRYLYRLLLFQVPRGAIFEDELILLCIVIV